MAEQDQMLQERLLRVRSNSSSPPVSVNSSAASFLSAESRLLHYGDEDKTDDEPEASETWQENLSVQTWGPAREAHTYTPWATDLKWIYVENEEDIETENEDAEILRFVRPCSYVPPTHTDLGIQFGKKNVAAYVLATISSSDDPTVTYDSENHRLLISPHALPYPDLRNRLDHPDYLPPAKLCQYQACERLGYQVWRHDRETILCTLNSCRKPTVDHDVTTQICLGCGPKSRIRYCSRTHLIRDLRKHWKACGHPSTVHNWVVDEGTQPDRFYRRYPAIADCQNKRSYHKLRQRTYAIYNKGQYTLFTSPAYPRIVEWPEDLASTFKPLVERLLNIAFFDQSQEGVVHYLFCLLRFCLRRQNLWTQWIFRTLSIQFKLEFGWDCDLAFYEDPCDCVWFGDSTDKMNCTSACKLFADKIGILYRGGGLKYLVEKLEAEHWILRIWQRQHPTVKGWRSRLYGLGFEGVPEYQTFAAAMVPVMGKGWHGWGSISHKAGEWRKPDQPNEFLMIKDQTVMVVELEEEEDG